MTGRRAAATLATLAAIAGAAAPAIAGKEDVVRTKVSLIDKRDSPRFKGVVSSPASECAVGRKVLLYRKQRGRDDKLGKAFAGLGGKYQLKVGVKDGLEVYAAVRRLTSPTDTICRPARSDVVRTR